MTVIQPSAVALKARGPAGPVGPGGGERSGPVIVLTYAHAGGARLQALLSAHPALTCTAGTGLLPACSQAVAAWRQAEGRPEGVLSPLAASSVRTLAASLMTAVLARSGKSRWCETVAAERSAAEAFLALFPAAQFLCLHRSCQDVIYATLRASPWGLAGPGFAAYTAAYPGSTVAALAAWWAGHARPMLAFEQDHPHACLRVRYEDLAEDPARIERDVLEFLGLDEQVPGLPEPPGNDGPALAGADAPGCGADLPAEQIPSPLLAQVSNLHSRLGYPPVQAGM